MTLINGTIYFDVDGVEYTPDAIEGIRELIIELRNGALDAQRFDYAVGLSHSLAYLAQYKEIIADATRSQEGAVSGSGEVREDSGDSTVRDAGVQGSELHEPQAPHDADEDRLLR